jgi:dienelactone hydrolase
MMKEKPMRRALKVAAVVILAVCGCDSDPAQVGPGTNGSIRGTVTDNTGAAVENAAVALTGNAQAARTTNSGVDGDYTFANVPPGTYTLAVTPPAGFTIGAAGAASVTVASGAQADAPAIVLYSCAVPQGPLRLDFFGGVATEADRNLFAYDVDAPLNLQKTLEATTNGVQRSAISYTSPDGGSVPGLLFDPVNRSGQRPGVVYVQGFPGFARGGPTVAAAQLLAEHGAVVIVIDLPIVRRAGPPIQFTAQDRAEQIQLIKDLQRAVDVLLAQPNVDPERIGFIGHSYGGAMGALFVGIERRIKAAVLMAADGGIVTHFMSSVSGMSCTTRNAWLRAMVPIESIRFIAFAPPTALLLQNGRLDPATLPANATVLHEATPDPSTILWYDAGHGLNQQAVTDRYNWLHERIGLDPL